MEVGGSAGFFSSFVLAKRSSIFHRFIDMHDVTVDTVFDGRLRVKQMRKGYRFSIDAVLLAYFAGPLTDETVLDLGTGCGIIPLILACRYRDVVVHGVELQPELAKIADLNAEENGLSDRVRIHALDMKRLTSSLTSGPVDRVVCNPPFYPMDRGRLNPDTQRAVARHEINVTLSEMISAAGRMLRDGGKLSVVYPVERLADMLLEMRRGGLSPGALRFVHPREKEPAKLCLVEGVKGDGATLKVPPPLILHQASGDYTEEAAAMFLP